MPQTATSYYDNMGRVWKVTMPDVTAGRYRDAIERALQHAEVRPEDVTLITPHGVGSGPYDRFEAISLAGVFGRNGERWPPLMVLKGAVGHTLGGCALVETVASLLALARGEIPISARCAEPDPELALGRTRGDAMTSPWALDPRWVLLKCTNGFAGQNGAMVLRSVDG